MPLGVVSRVLFGFWGDFWGKSQKGKTRKIWAKQASTSKRREPTPQRGMPSPRRGRGVQKGTPRVRRSVALCCSIDTVHSEKIFGFCFRAPPFRIPIV